MDKNTVEGFSIDGFSCEITRIDDHLNGYVAVPKGHWAYGKHYTRMNPPFLFVHGGITYFGSDDAGWQFGFDCAHPDDTPENCDINFVKSELAKLIDQLKKEPLMKISGEMLQSDAIEGLGIVPFMYLDLESVVE